MLYDGMKNNALIIEELDEMVGNDEIERYDYFCTFIAPEYVNFWKMTLSKTGIKLEFDELMKEYDKWRIEEQKLHFDHFVALAA